MGRAAPLLLALLLGACASMLEEVASRCSPPADFETQAQVSGVSDSRGDRYSEGADAWCRGENIKVVGHERYVYKKKTLDRGVRDRDPYTVTERYDRSVKSYETKSLTFGPFVLTFGWGEGSELHQRKRRR